jgi:F420-dependent oxidoreductase-like protein
VWKVADELPVFESAWTFDHFEPIFSDRTGPCLEGWITTTALAQATNRIRVGVLVTGMPYRHPAVLANMAATLDVISGGRLELGVGAGWNQDEADALGIELPPLRERFDRFDEGVEAIVRLLSLEVTTFEGRYVQLRDARCEPKPVQRPHPPIVIGGRGPKRTLKTAARWAQHWNVIVPGPAEWTALKEILVGHCEAIGRDPAEITCSVNVRLNEVGGIGPGSELAARYQEAGVDLVIFNLPQPFDPAVLDPLADAVSAVG